jgi:hypothetical protein
LARAAPSFMSSSSRSRSMAAISLSRAHSHLSLRLVGCFRPKRRDS